MAHDPNLLDLLESIEARSWAGEVFRYTAGGRPPSRENTLGARWNPREVPTIYMALEHDTAIAEFQHQLDALSPRPSRGQFTLYTIRMHVEGILELRTRGLLPSMGITAGELSSDDFAACQRVGGAAAWLQRGGLLVPSARRSEGANLVIFTHEQDPNFEFEILNQESLPI